MAMLQFPWVMDIDPEATLTLNDNEPYPVGTHIRFLNNRKWSTDVEEFNQLKRGKVTITEFALAPGEDWFRIPFGVLRVSIIPFIEGLESVAYLFSLSANLKNINKDLFKYNPQIRDFHDCFHGCEQLRSIPKGLFEYNVNAYDFSDCFSHCENIINIPPGLFTNTKVTHFKQLSECFAKCERITKLDHLIFPDSFKLTNEGIDRIFGTTDIELSREVQLSMM